MSSDKTPSLRELIEQFFGTPVRVSATMPKTDGIPPVKK